MSEYKLSLLHKVLILSVNVFVLSSVTLAMYLAAQNPEEFTVIFIKVFGGALVPILSLGFVGKRFLQRRMTELVGETA